MIKHQVGGKFNKGEHLPSHDRGGIRVRFGMMEGPVGRQLHNHQTTGTRQGEIIAMRTERKGAHCEQGRIRQCDDLGEGKRSRVNVALRKCSEILLIGT